MAKDSKRKPLFMMLLLTVLLVSSAYASLIPIVNAAEPTVQDKTIDALNDVVGINTEEYTTVRSSQLDNSYLNLPQKEVDITLVSDQGRVRASCSFVNNMLRQIYLSDYEGDLAVEQPAIATADMAKGFLQRYQNYAGDSFYGELASTLDNVDVSANVTKSAGNIKLEVLNWDQAIVDYVWTYADENGIVAKSKNVILSYDRGQLKVFLNNWPLYKVAGTPKISAEEATAIALEASKNFSYEIEIDNVTSTVTGFNINPKSLGHAKLSYLNCPNQSLARGGDPLTLYPSWYVPLGFDKSYPGGVTGMTVTIWADTGEVSTTNPMVVGFPSAASADEKESAISAEAVTAEVFSQELPASAPFVAVAIFTVTGVAIVSAKKSKFAGGRKPFKKSWVALLCGVILSSVILGAVPTAFADEHLPNSKARIYAALDGGQGSPAQIPEEKEAAYWVAGEIANAFSYSGYTVSNDAGWGTRAEWIPGNAYSDEHSYENVTVFHFGHLAEFNLGYVDNYGAPVWSTILYDHTGLGKHSFVFMWVCAQAMSEQWWNETHPGTPVAWTHRDASPGRPYMSANGYTNPDGQDQCYIGFYLFSPQIGNDTQTFEEQWTYACKIFIQSFYNYSLKIGYSIKESLDRTCLDFFGYTFTSSIFNTGYHAWWPGGLPGFPPAGYIEGRMRVFGDGNMRIVQPRITLAANTVIAPTFYFDGVPHSLGTINLWPYPRQYTIEVTDVPCYEFDHFHYEEASGGWGSWWFQPLTISFEYAGTFTAVYTPIQQPLTISSSGSGYTNPTGTQMYDPYTNAQVEAFPASGYEHYWLVDGHYAGNDKTINVYMNGPRTLQAVFYPEQQYYFVAAIDSYGGPVDNPEKLAGWQNDGQFAALAGYGPYQYYGWIEANMNKQATGHIYMYGCCASGYAGHLYVYVSSDGSQYNLVSSPYVSATSPYWIDCGIYEGTFNYIAVTVENPQEFAYIGIDSVRVELPAYYDLTISSSSGGSTTPSPGTYEDILEGTPVTVTADPDPGYVFDHWDLDSQPAGTNPTIIVTMNQDHDLQANFVSAPSHYWVSSIYDYDGAVYSPGNLVGSQPDGQFATIEGYGPYQYYGYIIGAMNEQATGHIYMYGYGNGPLYVYVSSNGYNFDLVSTPYVSSGSPYWIDCGIYEGTFNYIAVTAEDPNYFYSISLDSVRVEP